MADRKSIIRERQIGSCKGDKMISRSFRVFGMKKDLEIYSMNFKKTI